MAAATSVVLPDAVAAVLSRIQRRVSEACAEPPELVQQNVDFVLSQIAAEIRNPRSALIIPRVLTTKCGRCVTSAVDAEVRSLIQGLDVLRAGTNKARSFHFLEVAATADPPIPHVTEALQSLDVIASIKRFCALMAEATTEEHFIRVYADTGVCAVRTPVADSFFEALSLNPYFSSIAQELAWTEIQVLARESVTPTTLCSGFCYGSIKKKVPANQIAFAGRIVSALQWHEIEAAVTEAIGKGLWTTTVAVSLDPAVLPTDYVDNVYMPRTWLSKLLSEVLWHTCEVNLDQCKLVLPSRIEVQLQWNVEEKIRTMHGEDQSRFMFSLEKHTPPSISLAI